MLQSLIEAGGYGLPNPAQQENKIVTEGVKAFESHDKWFDRYPSLVRSLESSDARTVKIAATTATVMDNTQKMLENYYSQYGEGVVVNALGPLAPRLIDVVRIFFPNMIANLVAEIQPLDRQSGEILTIKPRFTNSASGVLAGQEVFLNKTDGFYASDQSTELVGTGDGSTVTFAYTTSYSPIRPGTVIVSVANIAQCSDDGAGNLVGAGISAGTVNYATGAISVTFSTAPSSSAAITVEYRNDIEQSPDNIRQMEIGLNLVPIQAKPHPLKVVYSVQSQLAASAQYNIDVQDTVSNLAAQFIRKERDYVLSSRIQAAASSPTDGSLNFDASIPAGSNYTKNQHYQDFAIKITHAESLIFQNNNRGNVSFILAGINACDIISRTAAFVGEPATVPIGAYKLGTYDGRIDIIKDPSMPPNAYVFGFRGLQTGDAAMILAEWIPIYFTPVFQNSNLQNSQGLLSMYDLLVNNPGYYLAGTISNYVA